MQTSSNHSSGGHQKRLHDLLRTCLVFRSLFFVFSPCPESNYAYQTNIADSHRNCFKRVSKPFRGVAIRLTIISCEGRYRGGKVCPVDWFVFWFPPYKVVSCRLNHERLPDVVCKTGFSARRYVEEVEVVLFPVARGGLPHIPPTVLRYACLTPPAVELHQLGSTLFLRQAPYALIVPVTVDEHIGTHACTSAYTELQRKIFMAGQRSRQDDVKQIAWHHK